MSGLIRLGMPRDTCDCVSHKHSPIYDCSKIKSASKRVFFLVSPWHVRKKCQLWSRKRFSFPSYREPWRIKWKVAKWNAATSAAAESRFSVPTWRNRVRVISFPIFSRFWLLANKQKLAKENKFAYMDEKFSPSLHKNQEMVLWKIWRFFIKFEWKL